MVWAEVTSDGKKAPIIFVEEGVKIDQAVYLHFLSEEVVPWVQREYPTALFLFQQMKLHPIPANWFKASALI
ncbi:Putative LOC100197594 [Caligus rogercresseyi]|uniref:LOC100197594 n=1 Tax=Caligus rogercresseyi TaxID=217165 RepID=A0A7T8KER5_CALRO|nr:Putative LOC100197594 [Caligus rogercresseyi]